MVKRDPRDVLGVEIGAPPAQIKAAWRRLARTNHPDLTGDDPAASRAATKRMAEINDASPPSPEPRRDTARHAQATRRTRRRSSPAVRRVAVVLRLHGPLDRSPAEWI